MPFRRLFAFRNRLHFEQFHLCKPALYLTCKAYSANHGGYFESTELLSEREWSKDIAGQIVEVSSIARKKHGWVRAAATILAPAFVCWSIAIVTMFFVK